MSLILKVLKLSFLPIFGYRLIKFVFVHFLHLKSTTCISFNFHVLANVYFQKM